MPNATRSYCGSPATPIRGFGGHFHNDNAVGVLRDIPGLVIPSPPERGRHSGDAAHLVAAAATNGSVCAHFEPIALHANRDLHEPGDGAWTASYDAPERWSRMHVSIGAGRPYHDGDDWTLVPSAKGVPVSLRVARRLRAAGITARVLDLRWLAPLPVEDLLREAAATGRVLVSTRPGARECFGGRARRPGRRRLRRVAADDTFLPLGDAALHVLVSEEAAEIAARELVGG